MNNGCSFCGTEHKKEDWTPGEPHDFRIDGNSLHYYDYTFGWEGIEIKFCPMCGRKLEGKQNE